MGMGIGMGTTLKNEYGYGYGSTRSAPIPGGQVDVMCLKWQNRQSAFASGFFSLKTINKHK